MICSREVIWEIQISLPVDSDIEFKYYVSKFNSKNPLYWDQGENRRMKIDWKSNQNSLRVMSFNIRYDNPDDGQNKWANRKGFVLETMKKYQCDFIGLQEVLSN
jgi:hypothetical protein